MNLIGYEMPKGNKYKSVKDVVVELASGLTTKAALRQIKYRARRSDDLEYAEIIQQGIDTYEIQRKLQIVKKNYVLPEEYLTKVEIEDEVGNKD